MVDVSQEIQLLERGDYFPMNDGKWARVVKATPTRITARYFYQGKFVYRDFAIERQGPYLALHGLN